MNTMSVSRIVVAVLVAMTVSLADVARPSGQTVDEKAERRAAHARLHGEKHRGAKPLVPGMSITVMDARGVVMSGQPVTASQFVQDLTCKADVVVAAEITSAEAAPTPASNFVFTDYTATVDAVLKGDLTRQLQRGNQIVITRPGGTVKLEGKLTSSVLKSSLPLQAGARYLLFLKRVPDADSYLAEGGFSAFRADQGDLRPASDEKVPAGHRLRQEWVIQQITGTAAGPCQ